jgi:hypothetical protein
VSKITSKEHIKHTVLFRLDAMGCDSVTMDVLRPNRIIGHEGLVMCNKVKI